MGTGRAFDATVRITDYAEATIGTSLGPRLLNEAIEAAAQSKDSADTANPDPNTELQRCLVAILCSHAAVEAQMNEVGDAVDPAWWATHERMPIERRWVALANKRNGTRPPRSDPTRKAVRRLTTDRNLVAHFRGVKQQDGSFAVSGPPVKARGGISPVRAYFDAARAKAAVDDANEAFKALYG
jgi:hypothetical protein